MRPTKAATKRPLRTAHSHCEETRPPPLLSAEQRPEFRTSQGPPGGDDRRCVLALLRHSMLTTPRFPRLPGFPPPGAPRGRDRPCFAAQATGSRGRVWTLAMSPLLSQSARRESKECAVQSRSCRRSLVAHSVSCLSEDSDACRTREGASEPTLFDRIPWCLLDPATALHLACPAAPTHGSKLDARRGAKLVTIGQPPGRSQAFAAAGLGVWSTRSSKLATSCWAQYLTIYSTYNGPAAPPAAT